MDLRSFPGELRSEFHDNVRPTRDALVNRIQPWTISHGQRKVMQADIGAPVKRDGAAGDSTRHKVTIRLSSEMKTAG